MPSAILTRHDIEYLIKGGISSDGKECRLWRLRTLYATNEELHWDDEVVVVAVWNPLRILQRSKWNAPRIVAALAEEKRQRVVDFPAEVEILPNIFSFSHLFEQSDLLLDIDFDWHRVFFETRRDVFEQCGEAFLEWLFVAYVGESGRKMIEDSIDELDDICLGILFPVFLD